MNEPLISVLIPAYRAQAVLPRCLAALRRGGNATFPAEILVESDDGTDYAHDDPRVIAVNDGHVATGVGPARNRALVRARAPFVTYVDADDAVSPDYLPVLMAAAGGGGALARTEVWQAGRRLARFGRGDRLGWDELARHGASFRGLFRRAQCPVFEDDLAQDILHLAEVMLRQGPLALTRARYVLNLAPGTVTAQADFSARVDQAYGRHMARLAARYPGHPDLPQAQALFAAKQALNRRYMAEGRAGESYYAFVARSLA